MKNKTFYSVAVLLIISIVILSSCDNANTKDFSLTDLDVELAEDDALAEDAYITVEAMVDDEIATLDANNYASASSEVSLKSTDELDEPFRCKVVTVDYPNDSTRFPKIITIDYGEGCSVEINGEEYTRKGMIQIAISDRKHIVGATRTTSFNNFYINDVQIEGTRKVTNLGENESGNLRFRHELVDGKITINDSLKYTRTCNSIHERIRASNPKDDVWYITGDRKGINTEGNEYQHEIRNRLMMIRCEDFNYRWMIVEGLVDISRNGTSASLDYGNGTCDDTAILTIDGEEREIKIRNRYHKRRRLIKKN